MASEGRLSCGARCGIIPKIIDVFICKLRKKLAVAGAENIIGTVWGRGYMIRDIAAHATLTPEDAAEMNKSPDQLTAA